MSGILKRFVLTVCFVFISTAVVFAATYWLPDYQSEGGFSQPGPRPIPKPLQKTCEDFNMHSIGNVPKGTTCNTVYPGNGLRCYRNCRCTSEYTYTSQTQTDLSCSDSCTDDYGVTKYKCTSCCPSGYTYAENLKEEVTSKTLPTSTASTSGTGILFQECLAGSEKEIVASLCDGTCFRCVDICGKGKKYCSATDSCVPLDGCCSDSDCGSGGKTRCDMSTHTCTYPLCESGYTESKPACPNGKSLCQQEGNPGCWGCCGVECNANYSTATTAESCKDGQTFETQGDNELCGICKGNICAAGYSTEVKNCPAPNSLESDANNKACTRCLTCEARGQIACGSRCIAVTSCCTNGTEGCGAGQKCSNGTCVTKTCEEMGQKTCGTTCIATTSCCSNGTEGCGAGQKCDGTGKCVAKTCEEQGLKTCGTKCIATTACCTNGAEGCGAGQKCDGTGKCVTKTCEEMGQKTCGGKCIATTACCSNGTEGCGAGQKCDGTGKCIAKTCEEQGLKTCGTKCIATTACCTNGAEGCGAGQKCDGTGKCIAKTCEEQGLKTCGGKCIATTACCTNGAEGCGTDQKCDGTGKCAAKTCADMGWKTYSEYFGSGSTTTPYIKSSVGTQCCYIKCSSTRTLKNISNCAVGDIVGHIRTDCKPFCMSSFNQSADSGCVQPLGVVFTSGYAVRTSYASDYANCTGRIPWKTQISSSMLSSIRSAAFKISAPLQSIGFSAVSSTTNGNGYEILEIKAIEPYDSGCSNSSNECVNVTCATAQPCTKGCNEYSTQTSCCASVCIQCKECDNSSDCPFYKPVCTDGICGCKEGYNFYSGLCCRRDPSTVTPEEVNNAPMGPGVASGQLSPVQEIAGCYY